METILLNSKQLTANEKQLMVLLFSCPLGETSTSCTLFQTRKIVKSDYQKAIESFEAEEINSLLSEHKKCLLKRVKGSDIEPIKKETKTICKELGYLIWTGKGNLDFLTSELIKRRWIKSQSNFAMLFNCNNKDLKIFWRAQYKYELAYLLYKLKKEGYFRTSHTRGYFRIAERYLIDYSKNIIKKNALKQISSKISLKPEKYIDIIERVNSIVESMSLNTNRL